MPSPLNLFRRTFVCVALACSANTYGYQLNSRWTDTATNPFTNTQGAPMTVTWSMMPDGATVSGGGANDLIAFLDLEFGAGPGGNDYTLRPWFRLFDDSFNRWGQLSGLSHVYEPNDDGVSQTSGNLGILGVRGDVRIAGKSIDGASNVLAFNQFPNNGDMTIDTDDGALFDNTPNDFRTFRNVIMHEHGHGLGLNHVESNNAAFLMEPILSTNFDGPQFDDIRGAQRHYGDFYEKSNGGLGNDVFSRATPLGAVASGATVRIGTHSATGTIVLRTETDFVSIDDDSDVDFFSFAISQPSTVNLTLTPLGATYSQGPQGGAQASVNTSIISNLGLDLFATDGTTLLQAQDLNGVGVAENITGFSLTAAGTYFAKVRGTANDIQMYQLDVSAMSVVQPGDFNADGNFNCLDINSLVGAVAGGTNPAAFDLNGDTFVNSADVTQWLALGGAANLPSQNPYLPGDANLDGVVDGSDFNAWNGNKFTSLPEWCSGDFTADGVIDGSDFNTWNINKFTSSDSAAISAVPEPISALTLLALTVLGFAGRRAA